MPPWRFFLLSFTENPWNAGDPRDPVHLEVPCKRLDRPVKWSKTSQNEASYLKHDPVWKVDAASALVPMDVRL